MTHWTLADIDWRAFDPAKVDAELLAVIKTAALVEANAADYVAYLAAVFADDAEFCAVIDQWGAEERQHGEALGRWAALADPGFDLGAALAVFRAGYQIPAGSEGSVRGSRAAELVARQVVETGTSSFYSALRDAAQEPVLKAIAARIAADEFRHYKLFADHARRQPAITTPAALRVAAGRVAEAGDDELGWAWYAANIAGRDDGLGAPACRPRAHARSYNARVARLYARSHVDAAVRMLLRAIGMRPRGPAMAAATLALWGMLRLRAARA